MKREIDREGSEKQWTEIETEAKNVDVDMVKKNGEEKSLSTTTTSSVDETLPKINPVKWTVRRKVCIILFKRKKEFFLRKYNMCNNKSTRYIIGWRGLRFYTWFTGLCRLRGRFCYSRNRWSSAYAPERRSITLCQP